MCGSRALFHSIAYLGARHLDFLRKSTATSASPLVLSHKGLAIKELRDSVADPASASSDENILAMLCLASAELRPEISRQENKSPFVAPLASEQWINVWGSCIPVAAHGNMMRILIGMKGGPRNIGLFGVAKVLSL